MTTDLDGAGLDRRLRGKLVPAIIAANALGALVVLVFMAYVVPTTVGDDQSQVRLNLVAFVLFLPLAIALGMYWSFRISFHARSWLLAGRPPGERELGISLRQPLRLSAVCAALWAAGAVTFAVLNAPRSGALGLQVVFTVSLGGLATCSLVYLLAERIMRPLSARALATGGSGHPALPGITTRVLLAWAFGTGLAVVGTALVALAFLLDAGASPDRLAATVLFLSVTALVGGLATAVFVARSVADPVNSVRRALAEVERGNLAVDVPVYDASEVGLLQAGFNRTVTGLRERQRIRDLFGRHVGEDVAHRALARGVEFGGEKRDVSILFVDIIGSTEFAATHDPAMVVESLNRFFALVVGSVTLHGGWVNKFEGDGALCVFGAPADHLDAATAALCSARELNERLRDVPDIAAGIGISAGTVVAGNIGTAERFEYTVVGDPVNEASRLTTLAKSTPGRVVASEAVLREADEEEASEWELEDVVLLRGRRSPTRLATPRRECLWPDRVTSAIEVSSPCKSNDRKLR